ncbi:MAG TPA: ring-cleaving dioxygenase [Vicinamibacterales bacterium]
MPHAILGLHHVTATVADAQDDLDFCLETLGLRLVKKTVNFDNHNVYHFYYGDERGTPGTIWTTFPYKGWNVPVGEQGAGQVIATTFSVPAGSLGFWQARLERLGVEAVEGRARFKDEVLAFRDSSGLTFEMVASDDDRESWQSTISEESAIKGLHSVTLVVRTPQATVDLMTAVLGFSVADDMEGRIRMAVNGTGPGHLIDIVCDEHATQAKNGIGTVHHVAMAIATDEEQLAVRADLVRRGLQVTDVRDRQYFKSIYFREPGGVLFEVATTGPGFLIDEDLRNLGRDLKLPPWEEPHRQEIENRLPQITYV